jgi:hypothetical protein
MRVSIRVFGDSLHLTRRGDEAAVRGGLIVTAAEAEWTLDSQAGDALTRGPLAQDVARLVGHVGATSLQGSSRAGSDIKTALVNAIRSGRVVAFRSAQPTVIERETKIERLGWVDEIIEEVEDVIVLAAQLQQIGDNDHPFIRHRVRILDPDTGEAVSDVLTTDEDGVVRTTVPEEKVYRIELLDEDLEIDEPAPVAEEELVVLRCRFVDPYGRPLEGLAVVVRDEDEKFDAVTDDDGAIGLPAYLGHYRVEVGDESFDAHAVLARDLDDDDRVYQFVVTSTATEEEDDEAADGLDRADHDLEDDSDDEDEDVGDIDAAGDAVEDVLLAAADRKLAS